MRNNDGISFREVTTDDVDAMRRSRLDDPAAGPGDPRMEAYFNGEHHPQHALRPRTGYVAIRGGHVAGYIAGHLTRRYGCEGEVQYLYVAPDHRRGGIAAALLRLLAQWFREHDARKVCVNANLESPGAVPFYESQGAVPLSKYWYVWDDIAAI